MQARDPFKHIDCLPSSRSVRIEQKGPNTVRKPQEGLSLRDRPANPPLPTAPECRQSISRTERYQNAVSVRGRNAELPCEIGWDRSPRGRGTTPVPSTKRHASVA